MQPKSTFVNIVLLSMINIQLIGMDKQSLIERRSFQTTYSSQTTYPVMEGQWFNIVFVQPQDEMRGDLHRPILLYCTVDKPKKEILIKEIQQNEPDAALNNNLNTDIISLLRNNPQNLYSCITEFSSYYDQAKHQLALAYVRYNETKYPENIIPFLFYTYADSSDHSNQLQKKPVSANYLNLSEKHYSLISLWSRIATIGYYIPHTLFALILFTAGFYVGKKY